jgi:DHA1 family multidrug resistance protein-like MFS transporter
MSAVMAPVAPLSPAPVYKQPAVRRLLLIALLAEIGYAVLNIAAMPVYLAEDPGPKHQLIAEGRGLGTGVIGAVLVAFLLSEAIFKSPMGALADKLGHRRLMLAGPCITTCTSLLTMLIPFHSGALEVLCLILLRCADGLGAAMLWPAAFSLMGETASDSQRQQAMSLLNLCYILGIAFAMPIEGFVNDWSGHKWASLVLASVIFASVAISVYRFVPNRPPSHIADEPHEGLDFREFLKAVKEIPGFLVLSIVTFMGIGFPMAIIKIFALDEFKMSESAFGALVFPAAIAMAISSVPLSHFGERIGRSKAVHTGLGLSFLGLGFASLGAFVPFLRAPWVLALSGIPIGVGFLLAVPAWMASVSDINPKRRGANLGAVMTAQGIGAIIGAPIGATLYEKLQPIAGHHVAHYSPFLGCTICLAAGWIISLGLLRDKTP